MRSRQISCVVVLWASALLLAGALSYGQSGPVGLQIAPQNSFVSVSATLPFTATRAVQHWLTSDATIAAVDSAGLVTGVQPGVVTITAISGIFRNSTTLTVVALPKATNLFLGVSTIAAGQSASLLVGFLYGAGVITNNQDSSTLPVTSGVIVSVSPKTTTVYRLVVTNPAGSTATLTAQITVVPAPSISSFTPAARILTLASTEVLTAVFSGGSGIITNDHDATTLPVTSGTPITTTPFASLTATTFTLTVTGANGSTATANVTMQEVPPPFFIGGSFTGSPSVVTANTNANITLNIPTFSPGATGVVTNNVNGTVINATPAEGSTLIVPGVNATTTFILTETNQAGTSISAPFTVTAVPAPVATSLTAPVTTVTSGSSALLFPNFSSGTGVINNGVGSVGSGSGVSTGPLSSSTTFLLTVTNAAGIFASINSPTINVVPAPSISSFIATPSTIISGSSTTLTGTFSNGAGIISNSVDGTTIPMTSGTPVSVSPTQDIIYTLTVTNAAGTVKSANTLVDVN